MTMKCILMNTIIQNSIYLKIKGSDIHNKYSLKINITQCIQVFTALFNSIKRNNKNLSDISNAIP